jgi:hypothetical protein
MIAVNLLIVQIDSTNHGTNSLQFVIHDHSVTRMTVSFLKISNRNTLGYYDWWKGPWRCICPFTFQIGRRDSSLTPYRLCIHIHRTERNIFLSIEYIWTRIQPEKSYWIRVTVSPIWFPSCVLTIVVVFVQIYSVLYISLLITYISDVYTCTFKKETVWKEKVLINNRVE